MADIRQRLLWTAWIIPDLRAAPREVQEAAFRQGLIPFVPADEDDEEDRDGPGRDGIIGRIGPR